MPRLRLTDLQVRLRISKRISKSKSPDRRRRRRKPANRRWMLKLLQRQQ